MFWEYGCNLRRGARLPCFRDFDLMAIHAVSPKVIVLDVCDNGERLYNRFVGTAVADLFGETTGKYMDEIDLGGYKTERLCGVYDYPARFSYERLVFPLAGDGGQVSHLTAVLVCQPAEQAGAGIIHKALTWPVET